MSSTGDPYFSLVTLLLEGNSLTDLSNNAASFTTTGISTTMEYPSLIGSSFLFPKGLTGQPFIINTVNANAFAANIDFTIELTAYCEPNLVGCALFSNRLDAGIASGLLLGLDPNGYPFVRATSDGITEIIINAHAPITLNALHAFTVQRANGHWTLYVDGVPQLDPTHNATWPGSVDGGAVLYLGCDPYTAPFIGAMSQIRVTTGLARYNGTYVVASDQFTIIVASSTVGFGVLSTNIATAGNPFTATIVLSNTAAAMVVAINGANQPVGSEWVITETTTGVKSTWTVSGIAPSSIANFKLVITATNPASIGGLSASESYLIINTVSGSEAPEQLLINSIGNVALWLDASDATTVTVLPATVNITQLVDKALGVPFTPLTGKPAPTLNTVDYSLPSVSFANGTASGLVSLVPVTITNNTSESTLFIVGKYSGQQVGQVAGTFQLSYLPTSNLTTGTAAWALTTSNVASTNASISAYDSTAIQDVETTSPLINPGENFLVVWKTASNSLSVYLNQRLVSTTLVSGTESVWSAVNNAIGFIGGAGSPTGAFISFGEIIAFSYPLSIESTEEVESYLNHKWSIYPLVPFAETPSTLIGYIDQVYESTVQLVDTTSASISVTGGTDWSFTLTEATIPPTYLITGTMPSTPQNLSLTINTLNGAIPGSDTFTIAVDTVPNYSVIEPPSNLQCQLNVRYVSYIEIVNANSVSISSAAGSGWTIVSANNPNNATLYLITGEMPAFIGTFVLTINAMLDVVGGNPITTTANFTLQSTAAALLQANPYPLDLTGLLPSNLINDEQQTLTPLNGPRKQLLIPISGPFFGNTLVVHYYNASLALQTAVVNVDYEWIYEYEELSTVCEAPVFGGISFSNLMITGPILLSYQSVGGNYALNKQAAILQLFNDTINSKFVDWSVVTNTPTYYPVDNHTVNVSSNTVGYATTVASINNLAAANTYPPANTDIAALINHSVNYNNPHNVTKAQLGLSNVANYGLASDAVAIAGTSAITYLTPRTTFEATLALLDNASSTQFGIVLLNNNIDAGDTVDATKALTGNGLISMLTSETANPIKNFFTAGVIEAQQPLQTTPSTLVFPLWWKGVQYANIASFVFGVQSYVGINAITFNTETNTFYFPQGIVLPDLTTSQTANAISPTQLRVNQPLSLPLLVTA